MHLMNNKFLNNYSKGTKFRLFLQEVRTLQLAQFSLSWLGDMKKYVGIYLVLLCIYINAESVKQFFKKLGNKKVSSDSKYHEKSNIFECFNYSKKTPGCEIFNVNSKKHIFQLTDQNINANYENAVEVDTWEVYMKIAEVS